MHKKRAGASQKTRQRMGERGGQGFEEKQGENYTTTLGEEIG